MTTSPTDRNGLEVLPLATCLELAASVPLGRVAVVERGQPLVLPVNHLVVGSAIVFQSTAGSKLEAALLDRAAAFEVDDYDETTRTGWSVVARGHVELVLDTELLDELDRMGSPAWSEHAEDGRWVALRADEISGRRLGVATTADAPDPVQERGARAAQNG